jgi:hypothetical protein
MAPTVPGALVVGADQPQVGFVDQGGRLEGLAGRLLAEQGAGQAAQLGLDERQQLGGSLLVATGDRVEDLTDFAHVTVELQDEGTIPDRGRGARASRPPVRADPRIDYPAPARSPTSGLFLRRMEKIVALQMEDISGWPITPTWAFPLHSDEHRTAERHPPLVKLRRQAPSSSVQPRPAFEVRARVPLESAIRDRDEGGNNHGELLAQKPGPVVEQTAPAQPSS